MRPRETFSLRTLVMLALMSALALAGLISLGGCGGGNGEAAAPSGTIIQGRVVNEQQQPVAGARVKLLPDRVIATGADGRFSVVYSSSLPNTFTIDPSTIGTTYLRYFTYANRTYEIGCDLGPNLPPAVGGRIELGDIILYRQDSVPPPPGETCP